MLLEAGNAKEALVAFEATMKKEPNRFAARMARAGRPRRSANRALAAKHYKQVVTIARDSR
jgi:Tfp pilus assembly protein PilF